MMILKFSCLFKPEVDIFVNQIHHTPHNMEILPSKESKTSIFVAYSVNSFKVEWRDCSLSRYWSQLGSGRLPLRSGNSHCCREVWRQQVLKEDVRLYWRHLMETYKMFTRNFNLYLYDLGRGIPSKLVLFSRCAPHITVHLLNLCA